MIQLQKIIKPDFIGIVASSLCLVHCAVTPFLFIAKACSVSCCSDTPIWWKIIDYLFLIISFIAISHATKNSSSTWIKVALWSSWVMLLFTILSETFEIGLFPKTFIYIPALVIIGLHIYNYKYCKCSENSCCIK
ncbi:MAG: MerC domain-containing protein [Chitinophagales bacterium]